MQATVYTVMSFIKEIRKTMPTATSQIVRMSADMQDLLVPMGVARDEAQGMTQGFLDLANKVAAFNDVEPTEVLEAIKSGLSGSSEPLRRFGINALESSLEAKALELGLLGVGQKFTDLDPKVKAGIRAQALLQQAIDNSSDAINGFAANNDSLIRRQQDLQANMQEMKEVIGGVLIPIFDDVVKALLPVIQKVAEWAQEHPKLTKFIVIGTAAIGALMAILGPLLLIIPAIVTALGTFGPAIAVVTGVVAALTAGVLLLRTAWVNAMDLMGITTKQAFEGIKNVTRVGMDFVVTSVKNKLNQAINFFNIFIRAANAASRVASKVPGVSLPMIPEIPMLAKGGIVTKPTLAMIGEAGPEAVIPLNKRGGAGVGTNINITINGDVTGQDVVEKVGDALVQRLKLSTAIAG